MRRRELERSPDPIEKRVLEELVFEKLRSSVDMCSLALFRSELAASVGRAVDGDGEADGEDFVMDAFRRAWSRVSEDVMCELTALEAMQDVDLDAPS